MKRRATDRWIVCLLLLALAIYGYSGVVLQMLGPTHSHHASVASTASPGMVKSVPLLALAKEWLRPVRAWRDDLHARSHAAGLTTSHQHSAFERHHHDIDDTSVISLDGGGAAGEPLAEGAAAATAGSGALPLGLSAVLVLPEPTARACPWPQSRPASWVDAINKLPERPPRA
jgi:hypothetical protein